MFSNLKIIKYSNRFNYLILLTVLFIGCSQNSSHKDNYTQDIRYLDQLISRKYIFKKEKEHTIQKLKNELSSLGSISEKRFYKNDEIIESYLGFQSDSALSYIDKNVKIARLTDNNEWACQALIKKSVVLNSTGLFTEAKHILDSLGGKIPSSQIFSYNSASESLYTNLYEYSESNSFLSETYKKKLLEYYNLGYRTSKNTVFENIFQYNIHKMNKDWKQAQKSIDLFIAQVPNETRLKAIGYYCKAYAEDNMGNKDLAKKYLTLSAISDIESATTENRALQELSFILYQEGDYETAYKFIESAIQDADFYNARLRTFQISKIQPIIEKAYTLEINGKNQKLKLSVIAISIMLVLLAVVIYFIIKQLKVISKSRNESIKLNDQLNSANYKLKEANKLKDFYMAYFVNQSAKYLNNFERFKKLISVSAEKKNLDKITKILNDRKKNETELDSFYQDFDQAVLTIYPDFIEDINKLMKDDSQYKIIGKLNPELRIIALMRLGIEDNQQISEFLRFSLRTIYNYKSKIKSKSNVRNEDFDKVIKTIGSI